MPKYQVVRPWFGVKKGQIIEIDEPSPAFASNLAVIGDPPADAISSPALSVDISKTETTQPDNGSVGFDWEIVRGDIVGELDKDDIEFDEDAPAAELAALLDPEVAEGIRLAAE